MIDNLEIFLREAVGQKYGLNSKKLFRRQTEAPKKGATDRQMIGEERTFFCSELIAKGFKVLGILENDTRSCAQYYPGHFSAKNSQTLKLT